MFWANAVGFTIRTAFIYKAANPRVLKGKDRHQLPIFWLYNQAWTMRTLFLDWFHLCFIPEVRKHLSSKRPTFKVLLILDNAPGHPELDEFNTKDVEVVYLSPNITTLIQPLDQGFIRTFKPHYRQDTMEESPNRENIMNVWKGYTISLHYC